MQGGACVLVSVCVGGGGGTHHGACCVCMHAHVQAASHRPDVLKGVAAWPYMHASTANTCIYTAGTARGEGGHAMSISRLHMLPLIISLLSRWGHDGPLTIHTSLAVVLWTDSYTHACHAFDPALVACQGHRLRRSACMYLCIGHCTGSDASPTCCMLHCCMYVQG